MPDAPRFRAFISYAHRNGDLCRAVAHAVQSVGLKPSTDADLDAGRGFTEQIQTKIAHSHLFLPLLTPQSHKRGWVHQEIGYATALKVPCVPICIGKVPEGMIAMAHALVVDDVAELPAKLARVDFRQLVEECGRQWIPPTGCALEPEERAQMIERLSEEALRALGPSQVRVQGALTSFSLPDEPPDHPAWPARYGDRPRSRHAYGLYRRERAVLERHAAAGGLRMIVNFGLDVDAEYGPGAKRARLAILVKFLESLTLPGERVAVALVREHPPDLLLAVGDWFVAESMAGRPSRGVIQTVFTAHAPLVTRRTAEFDQRLAQLIAGQGSAPDASREWAIAQLREEMRSLPSHRDWAGY